MVDTFLLDLIYVATYQTALHVGEMQMLLYYLDPRKILDSGGSSCH